MKQCPLCRTPYADKSLNFCKKDGTRLTDGPPTGFDTQPSTLKLPSSSRESRPENNDRIRVLLSMEIDDNLESLGKYQDLAKKRGKDFAGAPIGHALVLDGFRVNSLPKLNRDFWASILPNLHTSDLSVQELKSVREFYKELENLESIKAVMSPADRKRDNEREMERVLKALIKRGNPLAS